MILKPLSRVIANFRIKKSNSVLKDLRVMSGKDFEDIKSILMVSPVSSADIDDAKEAIQVVKTQFSKVDVTFFETTSIPDKSKNLFGYPKSEYLAKYVRSNYDLIIDMSIKYSLLNTYIISMMKPAIRVKVYNDEKNDQYYNFIFKSQKKTSVDRTRHCLSMLHHVMSKKIIGE